MYKSIVLQSAKPNKNNRQYSFITDDIFKEYKLYRMYDRENIHRFYEKVHNRYRSIQIFNRWSKYVDPPLYRKGNTTYWLGNEIIKIKVLNTFIIFEEALSKPFIDINTLLYKWKFIRIIKIRLEDKCIEIIEEFMSQNNINKRESKKNEFNISKINVPKRIRFNYKNGKKRLFHKNSNFQKLFKK